MNRNRQLVLGLGILFIAVGCGEKKATAIVEPPHDDRSEVVLQYDGELEDSNHFSICLPLWWPADDKLETVGDDKVYRDDSISLVGGRSFSVAAATKSNATLWTLAKEVYDEALLEQRYKKIVEGNVTYLLSGFSADVGIMPITMVSGIRYDQSKDEIVFLNFESRKKEEFTQRHRDDILKALRSAVVKK